MDGTVQSLTSKHTAEFKTDSKNVLIFNNALPKWKMIVQYSLEHNKINLLRDYGIYRTKVVNEMLANIMKNYCPHCSIASSGSTLPTSDYDVNVSGPDADYVVKIFNTMFMKRFGVTSAEMFDTNLYGYPRLQHLMKGATVSLNFITIDKDDADSYYIIKSPQGPYHKMLNIHNQHSWALLKFVTCLNSIEIETVKSLKVFDEALRFFDNEPPTGKIDIDNMKYSNFLHKVKEAVSVLTESTVPINTDHFIVKYNQLVSHANYHAQETYFSTGPYMHVVAKTQMRLDVKLSIDEYMDSFIENAGFTIQHLDKSDECVAKVVDSSKYMIRALNAYKETLSNEDKDIESLIQTISTIYGFRGTHRAIPDQVVETLFEKTVKGPQRDTMKLRNFMFQLALTIINCYFSCNADSFQSLVDQSIKNAGDNERLISTFIKPQLMGNETLISNVKTEQSLLQKVTKRCLNYSAGQPYINWTDALRYTVIIEPEVYVERVGIILEGLEKQHFHVEKFSSRWNSNEYRGVNVDIIYQNQIFELQFHTPNSYSVKMKMHGDYKLGKKSTLTPADRPPGVEKLSKMYSHSDEYDD